MGKLLKCLFGFCLLLAGVAANAQADTSLPLYKQFPDLPPLSVYRYPDSARIVKDNLARRVNTMVMIFSPDCDHCQHATEDLLRNMNLFKNVQIVMVTNSPWEMIKPFYDVFHLNAFPNILVGRDPAYMLGTFYNVKNFPSIFLYNRKGQFLQSFEGTVPFTTIASAFPSK